MAHYLIFYGHINEFVAPPRDQSSCLSVIGLIILEGKKSLNKIIMEFNQESNFEESGKFLSLKGCKETERVTITIETFIMAQITD